ncbi:retropepsin-like aspartic protease [Posidoniimonas polymericola]|uniref:retropepsin-like aspartic protease n=1 Tax=Posidoniimonas polymericola TaxID=2528002 RepID=UPI0018D44C3A|nr:retropepsin-like aspartic protease [Posidoniimonas polymericola]
MRTIAGLTAGLLLAGGGGAAWAQGVSLGGFIPFVGFGMTDESKTLDSLDLGDIPFIADASDSPGAPLLGAGGTPYFDLALFDSGAATHIITQEAFAGFDIQGAGLRGTNTQIVGGATGQILLEINDAAGIYAAGLGDRTSAGTSLGISQSALRGETSFATLTAPNEWELPNIIGLPMAAHHTVVIRNDQPQIFQHQGRTVRTPQIEFSEIGTGASEGITRRAPLLLQPGIGFVQGPQYVFNLDFDDILSGGGDIDVANNPASPSVIQDSSGNGGGMYLEVDFANDGRTQQDKALLFDTGADLTVISQQMAVRLGFDAVLDTPDFVLSVEGSGGVQDGVPGFYIDELNVDTIGGSFTLTNVPVAVLDVTNPNDPGNIIDGIIGTHLFNGRNLVIDANPSIGQGGVGPSLYIGDPVTSPHRWSAASGQWSTASKWSAAGVPGELWEVQVRGAGSAPTTSDVVQDHTVYRVTVEGTAQSPTRLTVVGGGASATLTVFHDVVIGADAVVDVEAGARIDAAFINIEGGELTGGGEILVGNGPINGAVRNISGTIAPEGELDITGDLANLREGVMQFTVGTASDEVNVSRYAFLNGELEVSLSPGFTPSTSDTFTLISAGEGVLGEFNATRLPLGYLWDVRYESNSVVLAYEGVGLQGDFNSDGVVDAADYSVWRSGFGTNYDEADLGYWRANYGATLASSGGAAPEPTAIAMLALAGLLGLSRASRD